MNGWMGGGRDRWMDGERDELLSRMRSGASDVTPGPVGERHPFSVGPNGRGEQTFFRPWVY